MKNLFVLLSIVLTTSRGCDSCKEDIKTICTENNTLKIPQEIKDLFWYKDSSYWIYKDSVSGQFDSCWISESNIGIENELTEKINPFSKGKCFETGLFKVNSNNQITYKSGINPSITNKGIAFENEHFNIIVSNNFDFTRIRFKGLELDTFNFEGGKVIRLNNINVNGIEYLNIINLNYIKPSIDIYKRIYYANKIGIIKYEDINERVWELVRYNVKQ